MVKLKLDFAQGQQAIDLPVATLLVVLPATMLAKIKEEAKVASTVKITVRSLPQANYLLLQGVIVAEMT